MFIYFILKNIMSENNTKINKYGNIIITTTDGNINVKEYNVNKDAIIVKSSLRLDIDKCADFEYATITNGLKYITYKNGFYIYGNEVTRNICPTIVDDKVRGCLMIVQAITPTCNYIIMNKNKNMDYIKNPSGMRNEGENSFSCCVRKLELETGILPDEIKSINQIGKFSFNTVVYDDTYINNMKIYYVKVKLSDERLNLIKQFQLDAIEKVYTIKLDDIDKELDCKHSDHHIISVKHVLSKVNELDFNWETQTKTYLNYLKKFQLYWN